MTAKSFAFAFDLQTRLLFVWLAAVIAGISAVYAFDPASDALGSRGGARLLGCWLAALAAGATAFAGWQADGRMRWAWLAFSGGLLIRAAAFLFAVMENADSAVTIDARLPVAASSLLLFSGLILVADGRHRVDWRLALGSAAVVLAVMAIAWDLSPEPAVTELTGAAWVISALLLIAALVVALRDRAGASPGPDTIWIAAGVILMATADIVLSESWAEANGARPSPFELQVVLGMSVIAGAALLRPGPTEAPEDAEWPSFRGAELIRQAAPLAAAALVVVYGVLRAGAWDDPTFRSLAGAAILATLAHQALVLFGSTGLDRDLRRATDALRQRHSAVLNSSPDLVAVIRRDGRYEFANPAFARWLGLNPERLPGRHVVDTIDSRDRSAFTTAILDVSEAGGPKTGFAEAIRFTTGDGSARAFEVVASPLRDQSRDEGIVMVARDVTERIEARERLRESETRMRTILAGAPDAILTVDERGSVSGNNAAAARMFSDPGKSGLIGLPLDDLLRPGNGGNGDDAVSLLDMSPRSARPIPCQGTRLDGSAFPAEASLTVITDIGRPSTVIFVRDVTQRMIAQRRTLESQKLEAIGQLAGGAAHDFNNLLTVIRGYSDTALEALPAHSGARPDIEEVRNAADRAAELTRRLLAFARRQHGEPRVVDPNRLIQGMGRMLGRLIREDIVIESKLAPDLAAVVLDSGQFEQVIMNLVVNARDAMPNGGCVMVETGNVALSPHQAQPLGIPEGRYVQITVRDEGVGMTPEVMAHIFEPFFTTKPPGVGTGLGLATCYGIVRQAGGSITVESRPGEGTVFRILLPATDEVPAADETTSVPEAAPGTETILLVEDEPSVRAYGARVLGGLGYEVVTATDGVDALERLDERRWQVDIVVTDIVMPRMSGRQLAERLRRRAPKLKVIFVSGYSPEVLLSRGKLPGDIPLVPKPFTADTLGAAVRNLLDGKPVDTLSLIDG